MHKFIHKQTGKIYKSTHCGNNFAEKELGLPRNCLKYLGEVKTNSLNQERTEFGTINGKYYITHA